MFNLRSWYPLADLGVAYDEFAKIQILSPRSHSVPLHQPVGILARNAALDQIKQQLAAEDKAVRAFEICLHAAGINEHRLNQSSRFVEEIIGQRS